MEQEKIKNMKDYEVSVMIAFKTINCDDLERFFQFDSVEEIQEEWDSESCDIPSLDDELVYANIFGILVCGSTFESVINYLAENFEFNLGY